MVEYPDGLSVSKYWKFSLGGVVPGRVECDLSEAEAHGCFSFCF